MRRTLIAFALAALVGCLPAAGPLHADPRPAKPPAAKPAAKLTEKPAAKPTEKLAEKPAEKPAEPVYNMGQLEVKAEDLSTVKISGAGKQAQKIAKDDPGRRLAGKLVNLGEGNLLVKKGDSASTVSGSIGTYGTVRTDAAFSTTGADGADDLVKLHYDASDGWRFKSDHMEAGAEFNSGNRSLLSGRADLSAGVNARRENLPGAENFATQFLERTVRTWHARADASPDGESNRWSGGLEIEEATVEGRSAALALDDDAGIGTARARAEYRADEKGDFAAGFEAASFRLNLDRAADASATDARLYARARHEWSGNTLVTAEVGGRKTSDHSGRADADLTIRRKLDDASNLRLSAGDRSTAYSFNEILLGAPGYVNLRAATGDNRFAASVHPLRRGRYLRAGYRADFDRGFFDLSAGVENAEDELVYIARNATDATVDAAVTGDDTKLADIAFKYGMSLNERLRLTLAGTKRDDRAKDGRLPFRPEGELSAAVDYAAGRDQAGLTVRGLDGFPVDFAGNRAAGHGEIGLTLARALTDDLKLTFAGENLANTRHYLRPGFPARGRLVSGGLEYRF